MLGTTVFGASKCPKLISRKIWLGEKSWNFSSVYFQLGCLGLYSTTNQRVFFIVTLFLKSWQFLWKLDNFDITGQYFLWGLWNVLMPSYESLH